MARNAGQVAGRQVRLVAQLADRRVVAFTAGNSGGNGLALMLRVVGGAPSRGLVGDVNDIALIDEKMRPAAPPVGRLHPGGAGGAGAVEEHDRIGPLHFARNPNLDIHLTHHHFAACVAHVAPAGVKVPLPRNVAFQRGHTRRNGRGRLRPRRNTAIQQG